MTIPQIWRTETNWLTWQTLNHHAEHAGAYVLPLFICVVAKAFGGDFDTWLVYSTVAHITFWFFFQIVFSPKQKIWGQWCDFSQALMPVPFTLFWFGFSMLGISFFIIIVWFYFYSLDKHFNKEST